MKIKRFNEIDESISGWELVGKHVMGPNYPEHKIPTSISTQDTHVIMGCDGNFYTENDFYDRLYPEYLQKSPNKPLDGFNKENLDEVIIILNK